MLYIKVASTVYIVDYLEYTTEFIIFPLLAFYILDHFDDGDFDEYPIRNARAADPAGSLSMIEAAADPYSIGPWEMPSIWRKEFGMEKRGGMAIIKDAGIIDMQ